MLPVVLSIAERSAMRLDGDLVDLAESATHVDRVVSPADRVRSLRLALGSAHIISGLAAAWVHGAATLPAVVDVATLRHRRADVPAGCRALIRRVALDTCLRIDGVRVTSRLRTAVDLLADDPYDERARVAIGLLVDDVDEARRAIGVSGRRGVARSLERLAALCDEGRLSRR
jgi:hypothetical protein